MEYRNHVCRSVFGFPVKNKCYCRLKWVILDAFVIFIPYLAFVTFYLVMGLFIDKHHLYLLCHQVDLIFKTIVRIDRRMFAP